MAKKRWSGIIGFEETSTGDGRRIRYGALDFSNLPKPFMAQFKTSAVPHGDAVPIGTLDTVARGMVDEFGRIPILGAGDIIDTPDALLAIKLISDSVVKGVSFDLRDIDYDKDEYGDPVRDANGDVVFTVATVNGLTLTPFPAFEDASVSMVASGALATTPMIFEFDGVIDCQTCAKGAGPLAFSLVDGIPEEPPSAWFSYPETKPRKAPVRIDRTGRMGGYLCFWDECHISFDGTCKLPKRGAGLKRFMNKSVFCSDGVEVSTGNIFINTDHAPGNFNADTSQDHYANTGCAVADVAVFEDSVGLYAAGALRPGISSIQFRAIKGSDISPDWRRVRTERNRVGRWELVGLLGVNTSGFPSADDDVLVASGAYVTNFVEDVSDDACFGVNIVSRKEYGTMEFSDIKDVNMAVSNEVVEVTLSPVLDEGAVAKISEAISFAFTQGMEFALAKFKHQEEVADVQGESTSEVTVVPDFSVLETRIASLEAQLSELEAVKEFVMQVQDERLEAQILDEFKDIFE